MFKLWPLFLLLLAGCSVEPDLLQVEISSPGDPHHFRVEVADTPSSRQMGLMFREELPSNEGMLFLFDHPQTRSFWMKNTLIPLDILFIDAERRIISLAKNASPCRADPCPQYWSGGPALYVLEINGGQADALGIQVGDQLTWPE